MGGSYFALKKIREIKEEYYGKKESERIGVPLLGEIPLAQEVMEASDSGIPLAFQDKNNSISDLYDELAKKIQTILKKSL